jgi:hypothetical protein
MMPPFWSLGFHLCRWGYNNIENIIASLKVNFLKKEKPKIIPAYIVL